MSGKYVYQGLSVTDKYLTVYFADRLGSVDRVREVKVPMADLTNPEVLDRVDREIRAQLRRHWEAGEAPLPLGGQGDPPWTIPTP